jgi:hypothetical protein
MGYIYQKSAGGYATPERKLYTVHLYGHLIGRMVLGEVPVYTAIQIELWPFIGPHSNSYSPHI